jgi:hypothetical protein
MNGSISWAKTSMSSSECPVLDYLGLIARKIADNRHRVCAAPSYLDRRGIPLPPSDIASHDGLFVEGYGDAEAWTSQDEKQEGAISTA